MNHHRNSISIDVEYDDDSVEVVAEFDLDTGKVFWMRRGRAFFTEETKSMP